MSISNTDRELIWEAFSECFAGEATDYDYELRNIKNFPINLLKFVFFNEVAPVCGKNLLFSIPVVWTGFDQNWVRREINEMLTLKKVSFFYRICYQFKTIICHYYFIDLWHEIEKSISKKTE